MVAIELTRSGGRQAAGLKRAWWMRETSDRARKGLIEGETRAIALELTRLGGK